MALSPFKQVIQAIQNSNYVLVTFKRQGIGWGNPVGGDAVASSLALFHLLKKMGKKADIASPGFVSVKALEILPGIQEIKPTLGNLRQLILSLDISQNKINELSYDVSDNKLNIFLEPEEGIFDTEDITINQGKFKYDLIFVLDTQDLVSLGAFGEKYAELFAKVALVNIDHHPSNDRYGSINLVDISKTSTAELVWELLLALGKEFLCEDTATCLLAGIIAKTKSFKINKLNPETLAVAGELVQSGARREEIVQNFYRTRDIPTLKLWGRTLARLKSLPEFGLVWSLLVKQDFVHCGATDEHLSDVIDELITKSPQADIVVLLYEEPTSIYGGKSGTCGRLYVGQNYNALELCRQWEGSGSSNLSHFYLPQKTLIEAEKEVIGNLRQNLKVVKTQS